uniref:C2 domain-containing protein n=1 Tax=Chenopodium quinoa TaxID=63459 RepID=A0A803MVG9_CHEQI
MTAASLHLRFLHYPFSLSSKLQRNRSITVSKLPRFQLQPLFPSTKIRVFGSDFGNFRARNCTLYCSCKSNLHVDKVEIVEEIERPAFDINLAVILAGFAFEAYTSPPDNVGRRETDAAGCTTVYLSDTKDPTWNEEFVVNIKLSSNAFLQVAAWDANLVTPHKRMGNAGVDLEALCDGNSHELLLELEGMGGGGKIQLEVKYRSFGEIDEDKKWWQIPFVSEFLSQKGVDSAIKMLAGSESVPVRQFVQFAFGQLKSLNDSYLHQDWLSSIVKHEAAEGSSESSGESDAPPSSNNLSEGSLESPKSSDADYAEDFSSNDTSDTTQSNIDFWRSFADVINQIVIQKVGIPIPDKMKWDGFDLIKNIGFQSQQVAEAGYIESGLATPEKDSSNDTGADFSPLNIGKIQSSLPDIRKATEDILKQTDSIFSALMILSAASPQLKKESLNGEHSEDKKDGLSKQNDDILASLKNDGLAGLDEKRAEETRALFSTAESAMEAWAMLATALGKPSLIKSDFEKLCFLDNSTTDTQVAIWRDCMRKRLVVAFRGTEQARWKDLRTDLMLAPAGLNPERIGGDFKEEVQVHSGFLSAYDSVRTRIMALIKKAVGIMDDDEQPQHKWHIYCTGHSLGGALATLLSLELSSTQLAKNGAITVTMYNFGSPRVGNKRFAEAYNERVKDSWRVVNHRDIIPTVPRLMGYCHVAQPINLTAGNQENAPEHVKLSGDGYQGDVIGEATPDVLVREFMKGEKELVDRILQTEINIFRAIRDGSALMQHMEDFYYISLLESVKSNYQTATVAVKKKGDDLSVS